MPEGQIFLLEDGELRGMKEKRYDAEDVLQKELAEHTALLAGEQISPKDPLDWILIDREIGVPDEEDSKGRWSLDHLFIDQSATPTLVEVKRADDTRTRREVVAQMLDYAANATQYWNVDKLQAYFEANTASPEKALENFLDDENPDEFWEDVKENIRAGDIRILFVADEIPSELAAIVEFLNKQMSPAEVLAVEIKQYAGEEGKVLVPRVKGQTEEARQRKSSSSSRKSWNWDSMKEDAEEKLSQEELEVIEDLYEFAKDEADDVYFGTGAKNAAFMATFEEVADSSTFKVTTEGHIGFFRLPWLLYEADHKEISWGEKELEWFEGELERITGKDIDIEENAFIQLEQLADDEKLSTLKDAIRNFVKRCGN